MLGRREIRACSVDHDPVVFAEQLNAILPADGPQAAAKRPDMAAQAPAPRLPMVRKVKTVQDAAMVVQGALSRLEDLAGAEADTSRSPTGSQSHSLNGGDL